MEKRKADERAKSRNSPLPTRVPADPAHFKQSNSKEGGHGGCEVVDGPEKGQSDRELVRRVKVRQIELRVRVSSDSVGRSDACPRTMTSGMNPERIKVSVYRTQAGRVRALTSLGKGDEEPEREE